MKVEFLRAAKFTDKSGKNEFYKIGVHDVPEHVVNSPYFKILMADGLILEPKSEPVPELQSIEQRKQALQDKVAEKQKSVEAPKKESKKKK